jgi:hypothetical protein
MAHCCSPCCKGSKTSARFARAVPLSSGCYHPLPSSSPARTRQPPDQPPRLQGSSASAAAAPTSGSTENPPAIAASPGAAPVAPVKDSAHDDPFALDKPATARTAPASADELLQQARKSVGHIDQQLRAESPQRFYRRQTACRPGWNVASMRRGSGAAQVVSGCTHGRAEYVGWRAQIPSI